MGGFIVVLPNCMTDQPDNWEIFPPREILLSEATSWWRLGCRRLADGRHPGGLPVGSLQL